MPGCCSIRAIWILNAQEAVVFSRRFSVVEKRWRLACERENQKPGGYALRPLIPTDLELATAFSERKNREGSFRGFGIRVSQSSVGSDSWLDDPITRHVISLSARTESTDDEFLLWPLVLHIKNYFYILVLPMVEPYHLKSYERLCSQPDCGNLIGETESLSSLLLNLPCITGYDKGNAKKGNWDSRAINSYVRSFMVAHTIGDILSGDSGEPEVVINSSPSVGGLLDSLTGSIGIGMSTRAKPVPPSVSMSNTSAASGTGSVSSDNPRNTSRSIDKEALQTFISISMPFGTPLDLNFANTSSIKLNGFALLDQPPADLKQPTWKPYLYRGKQRLLFTIQETIYAAMYDREDIPDSVFISGQVNCRVELEGLPDVSFSLTSPNATRIEVMSCHPCAQVPEHGLDRQALMFTPPLGNFVLMRYEASCGLNPPVKGFYQLSMVSEDEGAFLFKLQLMVGYKAPLTMDFCTVTMPFPRRKVAFFDGNPSVGTVSSTDHSIEWKIVTSGRSITGKSIEATFPGTIRFAPSPTIHRFSSPARPSQDSLAENESDDELKSPGSMVNVEEYLIEKMNKDLQSVELEEPFCWQAYNYAKVSFKVSGGTLSQISMDPKLVSIYPSVKAPVEFSLQASSGDYLLWNTLGKCPFTVLPKKQ